MLPGPYVEGRASRERDPYEPFQRDQGVLLVLVKFTSLCLKPVISIGLLMRFGTLFVAGAGRWVRGEEGAKPSSLRDGRTGQDASGRQGDMRGTGEAQKKKPRERFGEGASETQ
jgi:hypothetical protein